MELSPKGAAFIREHEGFVPRYYLDPIGLGTLGTGFTWRSEAFRRWWAANRPGQKFGPGATMTRQEAEDVLRILSAEEYGKAVNAFLGREVPQHVFDAADSVVFNCGAGTLGDRWAARMKAGDYEEAAALLATTRVTAAGKPLRGLRIRRKEEGELLAKGDYVIGAASVLASVPADPMADGMLVRGERGEEVGALQRDLAALKHYDGVVDGVFGYGTEAAVLEFQSSAGLQEDGKAGPRTFAAVKAARASPAAPSKPAAVPLPTPAPREITNPATIKRIQETLRAKGYVMVGKADGDIGPSTKTGVREYEATNGLPITGLVTAALEEHMKTGKDRELAPARVNATVETIKDAPTVKAAKTLETIAKGGAASGALVLVERLASGDITADQIDRTIATVSAGRRLLDTVISFGLPILLIAGSVGVFFLVRWIIKEQIAKYRSGNHV